MTEQQELDRHSSGAAETGLESEQPGIGVSLPQPTGTSAERAEQGIGDLSVERAASAVGPGEPVNRDLCPLPTEPCPEQQQLSRRQFLRGGLAGGAAGLIVAAGTGAAAWQVAEAQGKVALEVANAEIARLQRLVALYEQLEKVNLDAIMQVAMAALTLPLQAVEAGVKGLGTGLEMVEAAALSFREALPTAQEAVLWVEERISGLAEGISTVEAALGQALDKATSNPLADRLKEFANLLLDNLPFGLGTKIRSVLDSLADLVTGIEDLLRDVNVRLLEPLRAKWFSQEEGQGVGAALITPLVSEVLDPLEAHLAALAEFLDNWQNKFAAPVRTALDDRAAIRAEIVRYKEQPGL